MNYREEKYFKETNEKTFLVDLYFRTQVCELMEDKVWFRTSYGYIKAHTVRCVPLSDLNLVSIKDLEHIKGEITGRWIGHYHVGVFWLGPIKVTDPMPYYWTDINDLNILK